MTHTVAIVGSRSFTNYKKFCEMLADPMLQPYVQKWTMIVSGGARGTDLLAARYAHEHRIPMVEKYPDYTKDGRRAPLIRNAKILTCADSLLAFWDGKSTGTAHIIGLAQQARKPCMVLKL